MLEKRFAARPLPKTGVPSLSGNGLLDRVYAARGVLRSDDLDYGIKGMYSPNLFGEQLSLAVDRIEQAIRARESILVVGDFDVDGATSTAMLVDALERMGAASVEFLVPDRVTFGYGLSPELVGFAKNMSPDLIVTVDNGVSSVDGVAQARADGIDVVVTDHHLPGAELPAAVAILNPNLDNEAFPSKCLAGVGVVFYLLVALRARLRDSGWFEERSMAEINLAEYLDLVALGTVADVVPLDFNNRLLVSQGLQRIRSGACRPGISALFEVAGRSVSQCRASDLGFVVGPRLNAAGRLDSMSHGIECLLATDKPTAQAYAQELDSLNQERRSLQADMEEQARSIVAGISLDSDALPKALCLYDSAWHQGVVGIVASRIKEQFHRPVIVFADGDDDTLKGSARSIPGIHIRDVLDRVASQNPGLVTKFGGHAMAAGLSLPKENFESFMACLEEAVTAMSTPELFEPVALTDGELYSQELNLDSAKILESAGPWGQGFPEPLFQGQFKIRQRRVLKEKHLKLVLTPAGASEELDAIVFNTDCQRWPDVGGSFECTYQLAVNRFRGNETVQLMIQDVRF